MMQKMQKLMNRRNKKGFTLIELIVVIAIIAILAAIAIPRLTGFTEKAKVSADKALAETIANACAVYIVDTNPTPTATGDALLALVAGANLIDSSLITQTAVFAKCKSASYTSVTVAQDATSHAVTVTLVGATPFVVLK